ncbi:hypothetical protein [Acidithiobacillus thiooxidans]|uniref:hypothetical protein n=1 Tax=Acidithiobacillus thiooxidans TaxID=930 RepID=UPI001C07C111|nr:hypothetical protein [Acidithiobacillus thiooxidans]
MRFVLSLMVLDQHLGFYRTLILPKLVALVGIQNISPIGGGAIAVSGFFVLSGYLIAHVLQGHYSHQGQPALLRFIPAGSCAFCRFTG